MTASITEFNKGESKYLIYWESRGDESVDANITLLLDYGERVLILTILI